MGQVKVASRSAPPRDSLIPTVNVADVHAWTGDQKPTPADGIAHGRPVGVAIGGTGGLLVADDVGNWVRRVAASP